MTKLQITKSLFTAGAQCAKRFYLLAKQPELASSPTDDVLLRFSQGQTVGSLARAAFPDGALILASGSALDQALRQTKEFITEARVPAVFEAAVAFQNLLIRVDILKNNFDGTWDLIEVKSTTEVREDHVADVAFQLFVLRGAGVSIRNVVLSHINNQVVYPHLEEFFLNHDLTAAAEDAQAEVVSRIKALIAIAEKEDAPEQKIGRQCSNPYLCEFKSQCWAAVPKGSTLELYNYRKRKPTKFELFHSGTRLISELKDEVELTRFQQTQYLASTTDEPIVDRVGLADFLQQVRYPIYYFDFETIAPPIPLLNGMRPYQRIPVQFSCHIQKSRKAPLEHFEFLASGEPGVDPRVECIQAMTRVFVEPGTIVAYHDDFERSLIRELAAQFPAVEDFLLGLEQSFWDLEDAFQKHFYHRSFGGSVSIKKVLPYFAPEMSYASLEIKNGGQAQAQLFRLLNPATDAAIRATIRENLLKYCAQDSLAMVVIHQKLIEFLGERIQLLPRPDLFVLEGRC